MSNISDQNKILYEFNNTATNYERHMTINRVFEEQVNRTPYDIAVLCGEKSLTYTELNIKSNQLARQIIKRGVRKQSVIAIYVERSLEMIIAIIAILKSGGAYLPINVDYPNERVRYILDDSKASLVLSSQKLIDKVGYISDFLDIEDNTLYNGDISNLEETVTCENLAYVLYTSGSTGNPKGVMIEHYSVINRISWMKKEYQFNDKDIILQKTPYTFDVSVWELFLWFFVGARVCLLKQGEEKNIESIVSEIERRNITTIHFVPPMLSVFLEFIDSKNCIKKLSSLKRIISSGEALNVAQVDHFNRTLYKINKTQLHNLYGPTEATVDVTYFDCTNKNNLSFIPIGKPIDNIRIYILDENHKMCPVGVEGEIYIAGDGVGRGYINSPDLTNLKFALDPFIKGYRMYKTGDLAKWMSDGNIEYLGRIDDQVKIRGNRVEIGEVETNLLRIKQLQQVVVVAREGKEDTKYLCAYYTSREELKLSYIRERLEEFLPDYMVPSYFIRLDNLPLTLNGKIDRKVLPDPENIICLEQEQKAVLKVEESNSQDVAVKIKKIIRENVDIPVSIDSISLNSNLVELGINSLTFMKIVVKIEAEFDLEFEDEDLDLNKFLTVGSCVTYAENRRRK